jgi:hypothetical protein
MDSSIKEAQSNGNTKARTRPYWTRIFTTMYIKRRHQIALQEEGLTIPKMLAIALSKLTKKSILIVSLKVTMLATLISIVIVI